MKNRRIILDTNLWISFLISKKLHQLDSLIENKGITLIFSNESLEEFIDVVSRPKFKKHFSKEDVEKFLLFFDQYGSLIKVTSDLKICRNAKDNFLLNLSVDASADFLITGDSDLLILGKIENTDIITFSDFQELLT